MPNNPRFDSKVQNNLIQPAKDQQLTGTYGIVAAYDPHTNRASVIVAQNGSEELGQMINDVPLPMTYGVQTVAPAVGQQCWVQFKDHTNGFPVVTHFFNVHYHQFNSIKQNRAYHAVPRYILGS